ncbi:MAG: hypothetical protein H7039_05245 [Bryobacteraceae bacterium]|nr:hypothetical protein [Bryobacteraceae bacterium]
MPAFAFPVGYFYEPIAGVFAISPVILFSFRALLLRGPVRVYLFCAMLACFAILVFISATGFTTQRYEVDFLPLLLLTSLVSFGVLFTERTQLARALLVTMFCALALYSITANMALGIAGPYDSILENRPTNYIRLASWFSPVEHFRPMLNPTIRVGMTVRFEEQNDGFREPLLAMGGQAHRYLLYAEQQGNKIRLHSHFHYATVSADLSSARNTPIRLQVRYDPQAHRMTILEGEQILLGQDIPLLVTAPSQVKTGVNVAEPGLAAPLFTGSIDTFEHTIIADGTRATQ